VGEGTHAVARRLPLDHAPGLRQLRRLVVPTSTRMPSSRAREMFTEKRRRAAQTLVISRSLAARLDGDEDRDLQQTVATARILGAAALVLLGRLSEGFRQFDQLISSGQEAVAEAFRSQSTLGPKNTISVPSRTSPSGGTLGQGDPRIAHIAFEESMRPGAPGAPTSRTATRLPTARRSPTPTIALAVSVGPRADGLLRRQGLPRRDSAPTGSRWSRGRDAGSPLRRGAAPVRFLASAVRQLCRDQDGPSTARAACGRSPEGSVRVSAGGAVTRWRPRARRRSGRRRGSCAYARSGPRP